MIMKKIISVVLCLIIMVLCASCGNTESNTVSSMKPESSQMKMICELATMECYYHNVAKYKEENVEGFLWWEKDKKFWVEYSGVVKLGIDASSLDIDVNGDTVSISMPVAKVLSSKVDEATLTKDSFIVANNSADINADDQTTAYQEAQKNMEETAAKDTALLANAQQRAQSLIEEYVSNIGDSIGKKYTIEWKFIDSEETSEEETKDSE